MSSLVDVVLFNPVAAGTADFVVSAARLGYLTPAAAAAVNGATYSYRAESADLAQWEVGRGVWNAGSDTLTRAVVLYNSLGNTAKINFTLVPQVGLVALATDVAALDGIAHYTNTTEATGVGTTYAARFEGGVEFAKKVFITGGVGVGGALNVAGVSSAAGLSSSSYVRAADGASIGWGALSATIVGNSSADVFVFYTASTERMRIANTQISISPTTASSSTTTGALIVGGGVGVAGALNVGGNIIGSEIFAGAASFAYGVRGLYSIASGTNTSYMFWGNATNNERARLQVTDSRQLYFSLDNGATGHLLVTTTNANIPMTTAATSGSTGALTVGGGVGIAGAIFCGGAINSTISTTHSFGSSASGTTNFGFTGGSSAGEGAYFSLRKAAANWFFGHHSATTGSGTSSDFAIQAGSAGSYAIAMRINATTVGAIFGGSVVSNNATGGIGYGTGAGGTVTQATNRTTGVTLNKSSGAITLFSQVNTAISQATAQSFTVTNSAVDATDTIIVSQKSGTDKYEIFVTNVAAGSFQITNYAVAGTTNEAPVFNFTVIKGVTS